MTSVEVAQRLARLEERLRDLESLQHEVHAEAVYLTRLVQDGLGEQVNASAGADGSGGRARPVSSVPEAARQLGISVSMVHKLLREGRLGHMKVGARTLITAEHVEAFLAAADAGRAHPLSPTPARPSTGEASGRAVDEVAGGAA